MCVLFNRMYWESLAFGAVVALTATGCGGRTELWVAGPDPMADKPGGIDVEPPLELGIHIATGADDFTCGTRWGTAKCWGYNSQGTLGNGATVEQFLPMQVANISEVSLVGTGQSHACALLWDRTVYCWGGNQAGEVGDGTGCAPESDCPAGTRQWPTIALDNVAALSLSGSGYHTCVRRTDGTVACWGQNSRGQLCDPSGAPYHFAPTTIAALEGAIEVRTGHLTTCARWSPDAVQCCGWNKFGQLGDGTTTDHATPTSVIGLSNVDQIVIGGVHSCAVLLDRTIKCWGRNDSGQLGNGTTADSLIAVTVAGISNAIGMTAGMAHSCAWLADGTARCWGNNTNGQLGDGTTVNRSTPTKIPHLSDVVEMAVGLFHTCALRSNGEMLCWGRNRWGEIGDGTTEQRLVPTPVAW